MPQQPSEHSRSPQYPRERGQAAPHASHLPPSNETDPRATAVRSTPAPPPGVRATPDTGKRARAASREAAALPTDTGGTGVVAAQAAQSATADAATVVLPTTAGGAPYDRMPLRPMPWSGPQAPGNLGHPLEHPLEHHRVLLRHGDGEIDSLTTLTVGPRMAAGLSYVLWWVSGLIVYFNERRNHYVRFHAVQSMLWTGALTVYSVLAYVVTNLAFDLYVSTSQHVFMTLGQGLALFSFVAVLMLWLAPMIAAWSGTYLRLPIVGGYAERYADVFLPTMADPPRPR